MQGRTKVGMICVQEMLDMGCSELEKQTHPAISSRYQCPWGRALAHCRFHSCKRLKVEGKLRTRIKAAGYAELFTLEGQNDQNDFPLALVLPQKLRQTCIAINGLKQ